MNKNYLLPVHNIVFFNCFHNQIIKLSDRCIDLQVKTKLDTWFYI